MRWGDAMHFVRIGKKTLNLDSISYCEAQIWQEDEMSLKIYFAGSANNTPLVFAETTPRNYGSTWNTLLKNPSRPPASLLNSRIVRFASHMILADASARVSFEGSLL